MTTATHLDVESMRDAVRDAAARAELGDIVSLMPKDILGLDGPAVPVCWSASYGRSEIQAVLYELLGNESIRTGQAEEFVERERRWEPHEFSSPRRPCVSVYLTLVTAGEPEPYIKFEVGPSGGYPTT